MKLSIFLLSLSLSALLASDLQNDLDLIYERRLQELVDDNHDLILASQWYVRPLNETLLLQQTWRCKST